MNIALVHQYFKTPEDGGAIRSYYIANHLAQQGHNVQVITAYNGERYVIKELNGYCIHYLPIYYSNHLSFWSRIHAFWLFVYSAFRLLKKLRPIDLNYVISTPLTTGLVALLAKKRYGIPYVFEVGDLWPAAPIQLGVLKNPALVNTAQKLEIKSYRHAESIVALSPDIRKYILQKVPTKQVYIITNMSDIDFFSSAQKKDHSESLNDKFVIGYFGTFGLANHLEYLIDAARISPKNIHFVMMGSGAQYENIRKAAKDLKNITWPSPGNKEKVREAMKQCDALYISFHKAPVLAAGCPNKLFDGLAAGKLIIVNFQGWIKELIEKQGCGFAYNPENPTDFVKGLGFYLADNKLVREAQLKASQLAQNLFSVEIQLAGLNDIVINATETRL